MPYDLRTAEKGKKFAICKTSEEEDDGAGNPAVGTSCVCVNGFAEAEHGVFNPMHIEF